MSQILGLLGLAAVPLILVLALLLACAVVFDLAQHLSTTVNTQLQSWRYSSHHSFDEGLSHHQPERRARPDRREISDRRQPLNA